MTVYPIHLKRLGEDAIPKEMRYLIETARSEKARVLCVDLRACSPYLRTITRHALAALKKEGRIEHFIPAERFLPEEDQGAAFLLSREPSLAQEPLLSERTAGVFAIAL